MDEDTFEKKQRAERIAEAVKADRPLRDPSERSGRFALPQGQGARRSRNGIVWVRASDLLSNGAGRVAGLGMDVDSELVRRLYRIPGTSRRAVQRRAHRLSPLSAFGTSSTDRSFDRDGLGRS
ncbi:hypothetical protein [Agromyces italicus]|uniref:hypothetical protein n=1 Tax=Agromyces italicus TaxID=279572 RepID=UPI0003B726A2|nr:hypothetical protein [Agromyces italicus]